MTNCFLNFSDFGFVLWGLGFFFGWPRSLVTQFTWPDCSNYLVSLE